MIDRQRYSFLTLVLIGLTLMLSSWNDEERRAIIGPLPPVPDYTDSTQWFIVNRGGDGIAALKVECNKVNGGR